MSDYIPDPIEIGESQISRYEDRIDGDKYKCFCGKVVNLDDCVSASPSPYAPPICGECAQANYEAK